MANYKNRDTEQKAAAKAFAQYWQDTLDYTPWM